MTEKLSTAQLKLEFTIVPFDFFREILESSVFAFQIKGYKLLISESDTHTYVL